MWLPGLRTLDYEEANLTTTLGANYQMSLTLSERFGILIDICAVIKEAAIPTLIAIYAKPSLLLHPYVLRQLFFANVWNYMSDGVDQAGKETKDILLPRASGVVLDLGAGE